MNNNTIDLCNIALEINKGIISEAISKEIDELINKHNEWGIAIELLIDYLDEQELKINKEQYIAIERAMLAMKLGASERLYDLNDLLI